MRRLPQEQADSFVANEILSRHLWRGVVAAILLGWAITRQESPPREEFAAVATALI